MNGSFSESYQAFTKPLEPLPDVENYDGYKLKFLATSNGVNYVVRYEKGGIYKPTGNSPKMDQRVYEQYVEQGARKAETINLLRQFGLKIPPTYYVAGTTEMGEYALYSATEYVPGLLLRDYEHHRNDDELMPDHYNNLISCLCSYYQYCYDNGLKVAFDTFCPRQYKVDENTKKIWLIDTDSDLVDSNLALANHLEKQLKISIELLEAKFTSNIPNPLEPARRLTDNLSKQLLKRLPT